MTMKKYVTQENVDLYIMLSPLLNAPYIEIQELSKKKPESPLNSYKVKAINRILVPLKALMKNDSVYDYLDTIDADDLPTNSDVVLILSQYKKAMEMYVKSNQTLNRETHNNEWNIEPTSQPEPPRRKNKSR